MTRARSINIKLGELALGRIFHYEGRRYKVAATLAGAGVLVRCLETKRVKIDGETVTFNRVKTVVWSAGSEVEVQIRVRKKRRG